MPNTGNFNPEWGYLAPRPGFIRSFRMALFAGAIGTVAGMAVAVAFVARPAVDLSVAARTMAQLGESDDVPNDSQNDLPKSAAVPARAEMLEVKTPTLVVPQLAARPIADPRDAANFAAAESHSAATVQHPAALAGLAESPAVSDHMSDAPSGITTAPAPKRISRAPQPATVTAFAEAPELRDDAGTEISLKAAAAPAPSPPKLASKKTLPTMRVRTARADLNSRDRANGGPFDIFRTILGFDHQVR
jgi:hypothetical protein